MVTGILDEIETEDKKMAKEETLELMKKFRSRKWILTLLIFTAACLFSAFGTLTDQLANVFVGLGVSYNGFQGLIDWQKARYNGRQ